MSTKRIISVFICAIVIALSLSACSAPGGDARLVLPIDNEPAYLDPQIIGDNGSAMIMLNCMEGLVRCNEAGEIVPSAAESWNESADGRVYTFKLRTDGTWRITGAAGAILGEDYQETFDTRVTANDFVFALRRALEPETRCPNAGILMNIKNASKVYSGKLPSSNLGVSATDDFTLKIELERKDRDFLFALASVSCLPCNENYFNATGGRYGLSTAYMIFNGPFYLSNWADGTGITIRRNFMYRNIGEKKIKSEVLPQSVYFSFNNEQSTRSKKLLDETYHMAPLTAAQAAELDGEKKVVVNAFSSSVLTVAFNCADENMKSENLRRSIAHALDYRVFEDYGERPTSIIPGDLTLGGVPLEGRAAAEPLHGNEETAKREFSEALDELELSRINLTLMCDANDETLARTMIQSLQSTFGVKFGIDVEPVDSQTLEERIREGNYVMALYRLNLRSSLAKDAMKLFSSVNGGNIFNFESKRYESLLRKLYRSSSENVESSLVEAERFILDSAVLIPLAEEHTYIGQRAKCSGVVYFPGGEAALFKGALYT